MLTARCNLRCSYCYQHLKRGEAMSREVLRAACDRLLRSEKGELVVLFTGGEPLLEFPLVREAIGYLKTWLPRRKRLRLALTTNGMLLTPRVVSFLSTHDVEVHLSFDGTAGAQALRGRSTFRVLDRRLGEIRRFDESFYREKLSINLTVDPGAIRHLADSIDYFIGKGIQEIAISPVMTEEPGLTSDGMAELDRQFARIYRASLDLLERTGEVPVLIFRKGADGSGRSSRGRRRTRAAANDLAMCGMPRCETLAVEPTGRSTPCLMFAAANAPRAESPLAARLGRLDLGDVRDESLGERLARLPEALPGLGIFNRKEDKYSSLRRCGDCPHLDECRLCPAAIAYLEGNDDPNRVPDFYCAFNQVALGWRRRFPAQPDLRDQLREMLSRGDPF